MRAEDVQVIVSQARDGSKKVFPYFVRGEADRALPRIRRADPKAKLLTGDEAIEAIRTNPDPEGKCRNIVIEACPQPKTRKRK